MLIRVVYNDNKYDFINPARLDEEIKSGRIAMFKRSSGWAHVGIDPVRMERNNAIREMVAERRQSSSH